MKKLLNLLILLTVLIALVTPALAEIRVCEGYECLVITCNPTTGTTTSSWVKCTPEQELIINGQNQANLAYCKEIERQLDQLREDTNNLAKPG